MLLICGVGEDTWESFGLQRNPASQSSRKSVLNTHWKDWCWSWNSSTFTTWCEESTLQKRPWCWQRLKATGEGDDRGWGGWMASPMWWTWVWESSGSWWWTGKHGLLQSRVSQRVGHDWVTELNWTYSPSVRMTWETDFGLLIHPTWICAASATCRLFAGVGDKDEPSIAFAFRELLVYGRGDRYADRQL